MADRGDTGYKIRSGFYKVRCPECLAIFITARSDARHCSRQCQNAAYYKRTRVANLKAGLTVHGKPRRRRIRSDAARRHGIHD